jgi:hypothetical protein
MSNGNSITNINYLLLPGGEDPFASSPGSCMRYAARWPGAPPCVGACPVSPNIASM